MKTFKNKIEEGHANEIPPRKGNYIPGGEDTPQSLKKMNFKKSKHPSISGNHDIYYIHNKHAHTDDDVEFHWVDKKTNKAVFSVSGDVGKNPHVKGEYIMSNLDSQRTEEGGPPIGHHVYHDIWSGRAFNGSPIVTIHDNTSKGAIKLRNRIRNHPIYGKQVIFHKYNPLKNSASLDLRGSTVHMDQSRSLIGYKLYHNIAATKIVGMLPGKYRVKKKK